jgi:hypothetical protein
MAYTLSNHQEGLKALESGQQTHETLTISLEWNLCPYGIFFQLVMMRTMIKHLILTHMMYLF